MQEEQKTIVPQYQWAKAVKNLYNNQCAFCGESPLPRKLHAHHVKPKAERQDLACVLENGIALCEQCHKLIHVCANSEKSCEIIKRIQEIKDCEILLSLPCEISELIQAHAEANGESLTGYINRLISADMDQNGKGTAE